MSEKREHSHIHDLSLRQQVFKILEKYHDLKPKELCRLIGLKYDSQIAKTLSIWKSQWKRLTGINCSPEEEYASRYGLRPLTISEASYIAAIIDGEGCLSVYSRPSRRKDEARSGRNFGIRLQIVNTNRELIEWLQRKIGGYIFDKMKRLPNEKQIFNLCLNSKGVRWLIPQVMGFSVGKGREFGIVKKALDLIGSGKPQKYEEVRLLQQELWQLHGQRREHR